MVDLDKVTTSKIALYFKLIETLYLLDHTAKPEESV